MPTRMRLMLLGAVVALFTTLFFAPLRAAQWTPPRIDLIERVNDNGNNGILLHFELQTNVTHELQYTTNLSSNGLPAGPWFNLLVFPASSTVEHRVEFDSFTNSQCRFYRLHLIP
jgi:hypothetical protein